MNIHKYIIKENKIAIPYQNYHKQSVFNKNNNLRIGNLNHIRTLAMNMTLAQYPLSKNHIYKTSETEKTNERPPSKERVCDDITNSCPSPTNQLSVSSIFF